MLQGKGGEWVECEKKYRKTRGVIGPPGVWSMGKKQLFSNAVSQERLLAVRELVWEVQKPGEVSCRVAWAERLRIIETGSITDLVVRWRVTGITFRYSFVSKLRWSEHQKKVSDMKISIDQNRIRPLPPPSAPIR